MNKLKLLDLFSGIGGFSYGLEQTQGFDNVLNINDDDENDDSILPLYEGTDPE